MTNISVQNLQMLHFSCSHRLSTKADDSYETVPDAEGNALCQSTNDKSTISKESSQENSDAQQNSPIDVDKELQRLDYEEFDDDYEEKEEDIVEVTLPISLESMYQLCNCSTHLL